MLLSCLEHHHRQRDHHRPIRRQSGLVPLTLLLKPRLPPPTHHTGCGRHSTTANVGMPLAPLCLPSNPLSSSSNSRCPRVPVQVLQLLASATDQWQRWSLLSSESAPNSATRAMPRTLHCARLTAPQPGDRGVW